MRRGSEAIGIYETYGLNEITSPLNHFAESGSARETRADLLSGKTPMNISPSLPFGLMSKAIWVVCVGEV